MSDQAAKLRELLHTAGPAAQAMSAELPMIAVAGGQPGVGATTAAVNVAAVLADRGERVLLVDAAEQGRGIVEAANVRGEIRYSLDDVLAGKCGGTEAIVSGPAGVRVLAARGRVSPKLALASRRDAATCLDSSRRRQQRVFAELQTLADDFDLIVVDVGSGLTSWSRRFWLQARLVALVTTPDDAALLNAYAAIKLSVADSMRPAIRLLVNQADNEHIASEAHRRIENACRRFLSLSIPALPALPNDAYDASAGAGCVARVWETPNSPFGHAALWLGRAVSDALAEGLTHSCATACGAPSSVETSTSTARC